MTRTYCLDYRKQDTGDVVWLDVSVTGWQFVPDQFSDGTLQVDYEIMRYTDRTGTHDGAPMFPISGCHETIEDDLSRLILEEEY